jgi:hypothetical protein
MVRSSASAASVEGRRPSREEDSDCVSPRLAAWEKTRIRSQPEKVIRSSENLQINGSPYYRPGSEIHEPTICMISCARSRRALLPGSPPVSCPKCPQPKREVSEFCAGHTEGHWAVRVSGNWRLTFAFEGEDAILIDYRDYH